MELGRTNCKIHIHGIDVFDQLNGQRSDSLQTGTRCQYHVIVSMER